MLSHECGLPGERWSCCVEVLSHECSLTGVEVLSHECSLPGVRC